VRPFAFVLAIIPNFTLFHQPVVIPALPHPQKIVVVSLKPQPLRIVIDPGHGGHDDGASGPHGLLEKDVVLDVALRMATQLKDKWGAEVVMTRSRDIFLTLEERAAFHGDLFVSIHANSAHTTRAAGPETFFYNLASQIFASELQTAMMRFTGISRGVKRAPFVVLRDTSAPSVLAEIGFISNPEEEEKLSEPDYRERLAEALSRGLWFSPRDQIAR
jgi:N-acetylmuramoyl-L-alanine amidase